MGKHPPFHSMRVFTLEEFHIYFHFYKSYDFKKHII